MLAFATVAARLDDFVLFAMSTMPWLAKPTFFHPRQHHLRGGDDQNRGQTRILARRPRRNEVHKAEGESRMGGAAVKAEVLTGENGGNGGGKGEAA
jgi:hypothetical protein